MSRISKTISAAALAGVAYMGVSALMARGLTRPARIVSDETPASVGLAYQPVDFPAQGDNTLLRGWLCPPPNCTDTNDALAQRWIVISHGYGSNSADPATGILGLARDLHDRNFGVLLFDYRASGSSDGSWSSAGYFEQRDLLGAIDYLVDSSVGRDRIGVLGMSMGGSVALMACSKPGTVTAVVSDSAFADLGLMIKRAQTGLLKPLKLFNPGMNLLGQLVYGIDISEICPARALSTAECAVLIIHGETDTVVPASHATLLARASGSAMQDNALAANRVWLVPGAGHVEAYRKAPAEYVDRVSEFFKAHLASGLRADIAG